MRLSYSWDATRNRIEILDRNDYYPFGMNFVAAGAGAVYDPKGSPLNYKFGAKELQETGFYDFGARMLMPDIGRWFTMDPLAEKNRKLNPYHYAANNPIRNIDPDGRLEMNFTGEAAKEAFIQLRDAQDRRNAINQSNKAFLQSSEQDGPGPKYERRHYQLIQGLSTIANKLYGIPNSLHKLTEAQKQKIFKESASKTTAILMYEYASGTGAENRIFYPGDALTEDIKWSNSSARATTKFAEEYNAGLIKEGETVKYYIATSPDKIGISESIDAHLKGLADQSFWRGGMVYSMQKRGDKLYVNVVDKYTVASGISRNEADVIPRGKTATPLGTTTITIHFNYQWINTK